MRTLWIPSALGLAQFVAIALLSSTGAFAEDYLLRLEKVGYAQPPADGKEPVETVLHSVEAIAQLGQRFHAKTTIGQETIVFRGNLKSWKGDFAVHVEYLNTWPSNIPNAKVSSPYRISAMGGTTVKLGQPGTIAGSATISTRGGVERTEKKWRLQVTVSKYAPEPLEPNDVEREPAERSRGYSTAP